MSIYNYFMRNLMIQRKKPKNEQKMRRIKKEDNKFFYFLFFWSDILISNDIRFNFYLYSKI